MTALETGEAEKMKRVTSTIIYSSAGCTFEYSCPAGAIDLDAFTELDLGRCRLVDAQFTEDRDRSGRKRGSIAARHGEHTWNYN